MPAIEEAETAEIRVRVPTQPRDKTDPRTQKQPPYAVILHNDPITRFEYVVRMLKKIFHYGTPRAFLITLKTHCTGRSIAWSGMREHAELKAEQLRGCGPDPRKVHAGAKPLSVTIEPLPE